MLLQRQIKGNIPRDKIKTFNELLIQTRLAEKPFENYEDMKETKNVRCAYGKSHGHLKDMCKILATAASRKAKTNKNTSVSSQIPKTPKLQSFNTPLKNLITYYKCKTLGFIKSNGPKCSINKLSAAQFMLAKTVDPLDIPDIETQLLSKSFVHLFNPSDYSYLDYGA